MRALVVFAFASLAIAACSIHSQTVERKSAPDAGPTVVSKSTSVGTSFWSHE
ncbi:hypothetical protein [Reyranella sp.]|jgi:hypothetical protein|uniref:hypothetical protein n=1 Tax=Reyranella sp. TaxID=1929291 RepID=UPI002F9303FE